MADILVLSRLLNGAQRNVDLINNTPVVKSVKLTNDSNTTSTELTQAILDSFISHAASTSNPHSVTKTQVGLSNVDNVQQLPMSYLDTDGTLAANSDTKIASQKATKTYADTKVSSANLISQTAGLGAGLVGVDTTTTPFVHLTPGATVQSALLAIDSALGAASGVLANDVTFKARNAANLEDVGLFKLNASDHFQLLRGDQTIAADIETSILRDAGEISSILWDARQLRDAAGAASANWGARQLRDAAGATSANWDARVLVASDGTTNAIDWATTGLISLGANLRFNQTSIIDTLPDGQNSLFIRTGTSTTTDTGNISIQTADALSADFNSGTITLSTGAVSGTGVKGQIFMDGDVLMAGNILANDVIYKIGTSAGSFAEAYVSGVWATNLNSLVDESTNLQLNAADTTTFKHFLPAFDNSLDIGSLSFKMNNIFAQRINVGWVTNLSGSDVLDTTNRWLKNASSTTMLDWSGTNLSVNTRKITNLTNGAAASQDAATVSQMETADGLKVSKAGDSMSGALAMGTNKITGLGDPTGPQDAATKAYTDAAIAGLSWKQAIHVASVADVSIATAPAAIDGHTLVSLERILLKDQTDPAENGIYIFNGTGNALTRSSDGDTWNEIVGFVVYVELGTVNGGSKWVNTNAAGGTLGTTAVTISMFAAASSLDGVGTAGQNAYWTAAHTLAGEDYVNISRGGFGLDVSAFTGVVKAASGTFSASALVNADVDAAAAIDESKLALDFSTSSLNTAIGTKVTANSAITGATKTKITYDAKGLVTAGTDATTADIADSTDKRYVTDAQLVVIGNTSGTNTGDVTLGAVGSSPSANGASLSGQVLTLQPADATHPGVVTTGAQTIAGAKTFSSTIVGDISGNAATVTTNANLTGDVTSVGNATTVTTAPKVMTSEVAGQSFAASLFAVRMGKSADGDPFTGRVYKADNDATSADNFYVIGLVNSAASAAGAISATKLGPMTVTAHGFTAIGQPIFLGASGVLTQTYPTAANSAVVRVGFVKDANTIEVQIAVVGIN